HPQLRGRPRRAGLCGEPRDDPLQYHNASILCPALSLLRFDGAAWVASDGPADVLGTLGGEVWGFKPFGSNNLMRFDAGAWRPLASTPASAPGAALAWLGGDWPHAIVPVTDKEAWIVGEDGRLM